MFASSLDNNLSIWTVVAARELIKKMIPRSCFTEDNAGLRRDLERLALCAPHMLSDIGFERDTKARTNELVVWRRGKYSVTISSATGAVFVSV